MANVIILNIYLSDYLFVVCSEVLLNIKPIILR